MQPALFIDAKNVLYRAIYAVHADRRNRPNKPNQEHYFTIVLRFLSNWINIHKPSSVHMFWDVPRDEVWRRQLLATYKNRTTSTYVADISEDLKEVTAIATEFFEFMNVRQYRRAKMEADDLIYAATVAMHPKPSIIVSSDSDMMQIPFMISSSRVFDPKESMFVETPELHPAMIKALAGDVADSVPGYCGIGPKKSAKMMNDLNELSVFLDTVGNATLKLNLALVDLALCPYLLSNKMYVYGKMAEKVQFDSAKINELIRKYKVSGLMSEFVNLVSPFKNLQ